MLCNACRAGGQVAGSRLPGIGRGGRFAVRATSAAPAYFNSRACTVGPALAQGTSCRWLPGETERMLRGNLLLAGIALVEGWYLMSALKFTPLWTFATVAGTLAALMALLLLLTAWLRSD